MSLSSYSLSSGAWVPRNGYLLCCNFFCACQVLCGTEHYLGLLSCCSCHARRRKKNLQASSACLSGLPFPLRTLSAGSGSSPCPLALLGQLEFIFAVGALKEQECSCPGLSSMRDCTGGQRLGWSRAGWVSFREREPGWCKPGPHTFSKPTPSVFPFNRYAYSQEDMGLDYLILAHQAVNNSWHLTFKDSCKRWPSVSLFYVD